MKKTFFLLALVSFCAGASFAQGISGGLKAGLNMANQKFESDLFSVSPDARTAFHAGFYATIMVSETFGVQPEILYNSVGSKFSLGSSGDVVQKADYLTIPVMLRYQPVSILNLHAGPQFGLLLSAKQEFDGDSEDVKDSYKGLDLGIGLGAGVDLPMGLGFTARYIIGMSNIAEDDGSGSDETVKNNVFQLSVNYRLFGE